MPIREGSLLSIFSNSSRRKGLADSKRVWRFGVWETAEEGMVEGMLMVDGWWLMIKKLCWWVCRRRCRRSVYIGKKMIWSVRNVSRYWQNYYRSWMLLHEKFQTLFSKHWNKYLILFEGIDFVFFFLNLLLRIYHICDR